MSIIYIPYQGIAKRLKKTRNEFDELLEHIIKEHEHPSSVKEHHHDKDFVDILLSLMNKPMDDEQKHMIDRTNIKAIIIDMIAAALDTSVATIEWSLSELLKNPSSMKRLQHELENMVGMNKHVEETDLAKMPYLDNVVKETLRLYPVGPLLVPHESLQDVVVDGYYIKKKTRVIVNAWAIGRDPKVWSDNAEMFCPERFELDGNNVVDIKGRDFRLLPFGSGRRGCAGIQLGLTSVKLVLAQLVHCFNWELPKGMLVDELDMSEKFDLSMPRSHHLLAVPTYRLHV